MKYTITVNQAGIVAEGLHEKTDLIDWAIVDYLQSWSFVERKKSIYIPDKGILYTWVNYGHLIKNMPMLGISDTANGRKTLGLRFKKLRELGLIDTWKAVDNTLYFSLTPYCVSVCFKKENDDTTHLKVSSYSSNTPPAHLEESSPTHVEVSSPTHSKVSTISISSNEYINNEYKKEEPPYIPLSNKKQKPDYQIYGEFQNVKLTDDELDKLYMRLGRQESHRLIESMSIYLAKTGKAYKSYYAALLTWDRRDYPKQAKPKEPASNETIRKIAAKYPDDLSLQGILEENVIDI